MVKTIIRTSIFEIIFLNFFIFDNYCAAATSPLPPPLSVGGADSVGMDVVSVVVSEGADSAVVSVGADSGVGVSETGVGFVSVDGAVSVGVVSVTDVSVLGVVSDGVVSVGAGSGFEVSEGVCTGIGFVFSSGV
jgi:hypothetical protein